MACFNASDKTFALGIQFLAKDSQRRTKAKNSPIIPPYDFQKIAVHVLRLILRLRFKSPPPFIRGTIGASWRWCPIPKWEKVCQ